MSSRRIKDGVGCGPAVALLTLWTAFGCEAPAERDAKASPEAPRRLLPTSLECPRNSRALRLEKEGRIRIERYPYDPRDGVRGVTLLMRAKSCHEAAGRDREADRAASVSARVSSRIDADYSSARLALERSLANQRWGRALRDAERLLALTAHIHPHPYVRWLRHVAARAASHDETSR